MDFYTNQICDRHLKQKFHSKKASCENTEASIKQASDESLRTI